MRNTDKLRGSLWLVLAAWAGSSGCIHNHYYGTTPAFGPNGLPISSQVGQVCEVPGNSVVVSGTPSRVSGSGPSVIVNSPDRGANVSVTNQPRVVISQPTYAPSIGQSVNRLRWRRPDPETLATTRVEGNLDSETTRQ